MPLIPNSTVIDKNEDGSDITKMLTSSTGPRRDVGQNRFPRISVGTLGRSCGSSGGLALFLLVEVIYYKFLIWCLNPVALHMSSFTWHEVSYTDEQKGDPGALTCLDTEQDTWHWSMIGESLKRSGRPSSPHLLGHVHVRTTLVTMFEDTRRSPYSHTGSEDLHHRVLHFGSGSWGSRPHRESAQSVVTLHVHILWRVLVSESKFRACPSENTLTEELHHRVLSGTSKVMAWVGTRIDVMLLFGKHITWTHLRSSGGEWMNSVYKVETMNIKLLAR